MRCYFFSSLTAFLLSFLFLHSSAYSQEKVTVSAFTSSDPQSVVGILLSSTGSIEKANPTIQRLSPDRITISFPVESNEIANDTVATAILSFPNGAKTYATVEAIGAGEKGTDLQECPDGDLPQVLQSTMGNLKALVDTRDRQRELSKERLRRVLTPAMLSQINKLEMGLGLALDHPIKPEDNPFELRIRLMRLLSALEAIEKSVKVKVKVNK